MSPDVDSPEQESKPDPRLVNQTYQLSVILYKLTDNSQNETTNGKLIYDFDNPDTNPDILNHIQYFLSIDNEKVIFTKTKTPIKKDDIQIFDELPDEGLPVNPEDQSQTSTNTTAFDLSGNIEIQRADGKSVDKITALSAVNSELRQRLKNLMENTSSAENFEKATIKELRTFLLSEIVQNIRAGIFVQQERTTDFDIGLDFSGYDLDTQIKSAHIVATTQGIQVTDNSLNVKYSQLTFPVNDFPNMPEVEPPIPSQDDWPPFETSDFRKLVKSHLDKLLETLNPDEINNIIDDIQNKFRVNNAHGVIEGLSITLPINPQEKIGYAFTHEKKNKPNGPISHKPGELDMSPTKEELLKLMEYAFPRRSITNQ